jgi:hypothetical protein
VGFGVAAGAAAVGDAGKELLSKSVRSITCFENHERV